MFIIQMFLLTDCLILNSFFHSYQHECWIFKWDYSHKNVRNLHTMLLTQSVIKLSKTKTADVKLWTCFLGFLRSYRKLEITFNSLVSADEFENLICGKDRTLPGQVKTLKLIQGSSWRWAVVCPQPFHDSSMAAASPKSRTKHLST